MKRFSLTLIVALGCAFAAFAATTPGAQAGLFGGKSSTPSPSPSPSALPTASPEPPSVAIPRLQAKLKANPNDQQAMSELASEFLQINRPDLTAQLTQHLLQVGDKTAQVYYYDGVAAQQLGNARAATYDFEQASNLDPTNMGILAQLAEVYLKENRAADAERVAKRAVTFNKDQPVALMTLGSIYAAEQKYDDARAQFEAAFVMNKKDTTPIYQIATTYAQQNNIPMALQTIDRALMVDPKSVQALVYKARSLRQAARRCESHRSLRRRHRGRAKRRREGSDMVRKAGYFVSEKKNAQGEAILTQVDHAISEGSGGLRRLRRLLRAAASMGQGRGQAKAALALDPDNAPALLSLGEISMQNGKANDSVGYLKHYTQVSPDAQGFALLGQAYSQTHNYAGARDSCGKSFEIQRSPETLSCVAGADFELKNYKEAAQIFDVLDKSAHGFLDQNPPLLFIAAKSYQNANQCTKAVAAYKRLLPMMRKGTKEYATVKKSAADPCHPAKTAH